MPEGVGGEESGVNLPSAKKFFIAAMLLFDEDDVGFILFHSVIYNSVLQPLIAINNLFPPPNHPITTRVGSPVCYYCKQE